MLANWKITITEHDYEYTTYVAYVSGTSKTQAIVKAAALAGQEKSRREFERMGRTGVTDGLLDPEMKMEQVGHEEFWEHRDEVTVT